VFHPSARKRIGRFIDVLGKVWVDVLLSAGVQVEVCRVKAKDVASSTKKRSSPMKERQGLGRDGTRGDSMKVEDDAGHGREDGDGRVERDENGDEEGDGEWKYEGGDEGKAEGYWEREEKRLKVR